MQEEKLATEGAGRCPPEIDDCWEEMHSYGYCVRVYSTHVPTRQLPLASKQRIRRRNLWKRLLKHYPLYVHQFYEEKVTPYPDHYGPYDAGEWADVVFARTTMGNLKEVSRASRQPAAEAPAQEEAGP